MRGRWNENENGIEDGVKLDVSEEEVTIATQTARYSVVSSVHVYNMKYEARYLLYNGHLFRDVIPVTNICRVE
jgi:hypothetical protein